MQADPEKVNLLQQSLKIHPAICKILVQRNIETFDQAKNFYRGTCGLCKQYPCADDPCIIQHEQRTGGNMCRYITILVFSYLPVPVDQQPGFVSFVQRIGGDPVSRQFIAVFEDGNFFRMHCCKVRAAPAFGRQRERDPIEWKWLDEFRRLRDLFDYCWQVIICPS